MTKGGATTGTPREPIKTRKASQTDRRNSVSEITEYFQSNMAGADKTTKSKQSSKGKDKDKDNKGDKLAQKNSSATVESDYTVYKDAEATTPTSNEGVITNHDNENPCNAVPLNVDATTQTNEDETLKALKGIQSQVNKLEEALNQPKNGINDQLAKTQETVTNLYTDIHGKVSGVFVRLENLSKKLEDNTKKMSMLEASQ